MTGDEVKLLRAHRGCLGDDRRRRTRQAAKSHDKPLTGVIVVDIRMGQPNGANLHYPKGGELREVKHLST